ncbi:MAG: HD domain-containing protein [Gemmataceae bacterium]
MAALPLVKLHALAPKTPAAFFALLSEKSPRTTKEGLPFYSLRFRDRRRTVSTVLWSDSPWFERCETQWSVGKLYRIQGVLFETDRFGPSLTIRDLRDVNEADKQDGLDEADFFDCSRFDSSEMFEALLNLAESECESKSVNVLIVNLLQKSRDVILGLPASCERYFPFPGGWLEHTLSVCKTSLWLADHYRQQYGELQPPLNRDLILAGAILHEIGRIEEWQPMQPGQPPEPTIPGRLLGHSLLARDMIRAAAATVPDLDSEFVSLLEHVVLTHLTLPKWGSPRLPAIPEVLIIHHADDLDAKMEMYVRCLMTDGSTGPFTNPDPILKKPLLKQRKA